MGTLGSLYVVTKKVCQQRRRRHGSTYHSGHDDGVDDVAALLSS